MSGQWGCLDTRQISLILWAFLSAIVTYHKLLLFTCYTYELRQKSLGNAANLSHVLTAPTIWKTPHLLYYRLYSWQTQDSWRFSFGCSFSSVMKHYLRSKCPQPAFFSKPKKHIGSGGWVRSCIVPVVSQAVAATLATGSGAFWFCRPVDSYYCSPKE